MLPVYAGHLKTGCIDVPGCTGSRTDVSGQWELLTSDYDQIELTLAQQGANVTGTFSAWAGDPSNALFVTGHIASGALQGSMLTVGFQVPGCQFEIQGELVGGCRLNGFVQRSSCPYQQPLAFFVGLR